MKKRLLSLLLAVCMVATLFTGLTVNASASVVDDLIHSAAKDALNKYLDAELIEELGLKDLDVSAILTAAATTETSGDFGAEGNNLHWSYEGGLFGGGTLTITGTGAMEDFNFVSGNLAPWWNLSCVLGIETVEIADTVTSIGAFAFCALPKLETVKLPSGLTALPRYAIAGCNSLTFPVLPETLTEIGDYALAACDKFTKLELPTSVQTIGSHAFAGCDGFTGVTVPETVRSLGSYAFSSCDKLASVTLPKSITAVPEGCFYSCAVLNAVHYNGTVTAIGAKAFSGCTMLLTAPIPETVTEIGDYAFQGSEKLASATLPKGLQSLGKGAFSGAKLLTSIVLPDAITVVPEDCFSACAMNDVTFAPNTTEIGAKAFEFCVMMKAIDLPDTLRTIGDSAFFGCEALTALDIPGSVTSIGDAAFSGCTALEELFLRAGGAAQTIGDGAFALCTALTDAYCYGDAPTVTAADETGATFAKSVITVHYPADNATWIVTDGKWCGYNAEAWNLCRHDADGYTLTKGETVAPTCTTKGYTVYTCGHCGEQLHRDETDILPHNLKPIAVAPTCTEVGYTKYVCADCGYEDLLKREVTAAPTGHKYALTRTITAPTCTAAGEGEYTCADCQRTETRSIPATGHKLETQPAVAATCTTAGKTAGSACSVCGTVVQAQETVPALGHSYAETERVEPTATAAGHVTYTCSRCGASYTEPLPATGPALCPGDASCPQAKFTDRRAPDYWSHSAIDYCVRNGILYGMEDNYFGCMEATMRGQLVTMLYRIQNSPEKYQNFYVPFVDVAYNSYYYAAVAWAYDNGIVAGTSTTTFSPNAPITREQMATILYNYTQKYAPERLQGSASLNFPDAGSVSRYAVEPLRWAVAHDIISGTKKDNVIYLDPQGTATREQVASILMRYLTQQ